MSLIGAGTIALALFSLLGRDERLTRCAWMLAFNWLANTAFGLWLTSGHVAFSPEFTVREALSIVWFCVDLLTAVVVLCPPAARMQAALAATYALEMVMHVGFWLSAQDDLAWYVYLLQLLTVALGQIILVAGWGGREAGRGHLRALRDLCRRRLGLDGLATLAAAGGLGGGVDRTRLRERLTGGHRDVRLAGLQRDASPGVVADRAAQERERDRDAHSVDDILLRIDRCGVGGAGDGDTGGGAGDRGLADRVDANSKGDAAVIRHWLGQWFNLRTGSAERFHDSLAKMDAAAESLRATAQAMREEREMRELEERAMATALEHIASRLTA